MEGLEAALAAAGSRSGDVYFLFCGGVQPDTGHSWCPDCVKGERDVCSSMNFSFSCMAAEPVVDKVVGEQKNGLFVHCSVGYRDT